MTDDKLKPCPFCGGAAVCDWKEGATGKQYYCFCFPDDGLYGCIRQDTTYARKYDAIEAWNTRPSEALRLAKESMESEEFAIMLGDYLNSLVALREPVTPQDFIKMAKRVMENVIVPRLAAIEKEGV
jgi:hypothetical protein